ncbi:TIGR04149 family rSAM-modified RiPP [Bacteroides fragilis]|nr:TIGR04149 family rSAM-modified RiPP [Bacteroides fragilis]
MRKLSEIKLGQLNKVELSERELNRLLGEVTVVSVMTGGVLLLMITPKLTLRVVCEWLIPLVMVVAVQRLGTFK